MMKPKCFWSVRPRRPCSASSPAAAAARAHHEWPPASRSSRYVDVGLVLEGVRPGSPTRWAGIGEVRTIGPKQSKPVTQVDPAEEGERFPSAPGHAAVPATTPASAAQNRPLGPPQPAFQVNAGPPQLQPAWVTASAAIAAATRDRVCIGRAGRGRQGPVRRLCAYCPALGVRGDVLRRRPPREPGQGTYAGRRACGRALQRRGQGPTYRQLK